VLEQNNKNILQHQFQKYSENWCFLCVVQIVAHSYYYEGYWIYKMEEERASYGNYRLCK